MSYCQLIPFVNGKPQSGGQTLEEYRNSWGGAARIWTSLYDAYLKDPKVPYDNWCGKKNSRRLWSLAEQTDLPGFERAVLAFTFDRAYVRQEHFKQLAADLRQFVAHRPAPNGSVDHLSAWADALDRSKAEAIGLYATSCGDNLWWRYDEEKDESIPVPLRKGFEVYDYLDSLHTQATKP